MSEFNTLAHFKKRTLHLTVGSGSDTHALTINYNISYRHGATEEITEATVQRWRFACYALANFESWQKGEKWKAIEEFSNTAVEYHDLARVLIFGDIFVLLDGKLQGFSVNTFTENTSARELFEFVHMCLASSDGLDRIDNEMKRTDLDNVFPRNGNGAPTPLQPSKRTEQTPPPIDGHTSPHFGGYDYKKRESDYALSTDKLASFDIRRLCRAFDERDGSAYVKVFSTYNGSLNQYPAHDLKIKHSRLEKLDDYSRDIVERVLGGEELSGTWRGVYFMFKPEDADRHYPVLTKLDPVGMGILPPANSDQGHHQTEKAAAEQRESDEQNKQPDDIPF